MGLSEKLEACRSLCLRDKLVWLVEHGHATVERGQVKIKKSVKKRLWRGSARANLGLMRIYLFIAVQPNCAYVS